VLSCTEEKAEGSPQTVNQSIIKVKQASVLLLKTMRRCKSGKRRERSVAGWLLKLPLDGQNGNAFYTTQRQSDIKKLLFAPTVLNLVTNLIFAESSRFAEKWIALLQYLSPILKNDIMICRQQRLHCFQHTVPKNCLLFLTSVSQYCWH
jgi:hypothetical protein